MWRTDREAWFQISCNPRKPSAVYGRIYRHLRSDADWFLGRKDHEHIQSLILFSLNADEEPRKEEIYK